MEKEVFSSLAKAFHSSRRISDERGKCKGIEEKDIKTGSSTKWCRVSVLFDKCVFYFFPCVVFRPSRISERELEEVKKIDKMTPENTFILNGRTATRNLPPFSFVSPFQIKIHPTHAP